MDEELIQEAEQGAAEFYLATVTSYNSDGAKIRLDGQDTAMMKRFRTLCGPVESGARVVAMKMSGTFIVLGPLDGNDTYITTTISEIFSSITSGFSVSSATYAQYGKLAMFTMLITPEAAGSTTDWKTWATLKSGKRPASLIIGNCQATTYCTIGTDGAIKFSLKENADFNYRISATYILA